MEILSRTNILALYDKVVSEDRRTDHLPDSHTVGLGPIARRGAGATPRRTNACGRHCPRTGTPEATARSSRLPRDSVAERRRQTSAST